MQDNKDLLSNDTPICTPKRLKPPKSPGGSLIGKKRKGSSRNVSSKTQKNTSKQSNKRCPKIKSQEL